MTQTDNTQLPAPDLQAMARQAAIEQGFVIELPPDAQAELAGLDEVSVDVADPAVRDLRDLPWLSIDNPESRDLDQVPVAEALPDGGVRLLIGLADVDVWVPRDSALDRHAATNTTSIYTGVEVFHMLPERLSTELSSLNEHEERLAVVVELDVAPEGEITATRIYRARVRNHHRLAYDAVAAWLEGDATALPEATREPGLDEQIRLQDRATSALGSLRHAHGALDFDTIEARPVVEDGRVVDLVVVRENRARALVEQMMVSTNTAIASFLEGHGSPALARAHDPPARWDRIVKLVAEHGTQLPSAPDGSALAAFLGQQRAADPERFPDVSLAITKLLGGSSYRAIAPGGDDPGHFGLAVEDYTHATAPNRRYPDLVTQRLLKAAIAGHPPPYGAAELEAIAKRCTERTSAANKVERLMRKVAACVLLDARVGEIFDAIVTGVKPSGTFARLIKPPAEGRIVRGDEGLDVGDNVRLRLVGTDITRGFVDFERV